MTIAFYATGDPHFPERTGAGAWVGLPRIRGDSVHALARAVDLCMRDWADLVMPGDIFHGPDPEPGALAPVYAQLWRLAVIDRKVYYVLGNHDRNRDWLVPLGPLAVNVSGRSVRMSSGLTVSGRSWIPTPDAFLDAVSQDPRTDVGVYHQRWAELDARGPFRASQLPDHGLCVCGDVHVRAVLDKTTHARRLVSTGPLSPQSVSEFGRAAVHAVSRESGSGEELAVREVVLPGREFRRYDVESAGDAEAVMSALAVMGPDESLPDDLACPMVAVRLSGGRDAVVGFAEAAERLAESRGVVLYLYAPSRGSGAAGSGKDQDHASGCRDLAEAIRSWGGDVAPAARDLAAALVADGADPRAVLEAEWERHLAARQSDPTERADGNGELHAPATPLGRVL